MSFDYEGQELFNRLELNYLPEVSNIEGSDLRFEVCCHGCGMESFHRKNPIDNKSFNNLEAAQEFWHRHLIESHELTLDKQQCDSHSYGMRCQLEKNHTGDHEASNVW